MNGEWEVLHQDVSINCMRMGRNERGVVNCTAWGEHSCAFHQFHFHSWNKQLTSSKNNTVSSVTLVSLERDSDPHGVSSQKNNHRENWVKSVELNKKWKKTSVFRSSYGTCTERRLPGRITFYAHHSFWREPANTFLLNTIQLKYSAHKRNILTYDFLPYFHVSRRNQTVYVSPRIFQLNQGVTFIRIKLQTSHLKNKEKFVSVMKLVASKDHALWNIVKQTFAFRSMSALTSLSVRNVGTPRRKRWNRRSPPIESRF